ncbi:MAG: M48 family metalloprotease [Variovorax sp.]
MTPSTRFRPSRTRWLRTVCAAILVASQLALPPPARAQLLPGLGDGGEMTASAERRLGDQIARELYRDPDYLDDPVLVAYVQDIWQRLLAAARVRGDLTPELDERFAWTVMLGRDRSINAFALPGGYLGLHLGLIAVTGSADELATVLGHELTHVTQRHIARMMTRQSKQMPLLIAGMILGMIAAGKSRTPDAGLAVLMGSQAAFVQGQLGFSRDMEREADRIGYGVMTQAGFAPHGAAAMFEKLQYASRLNDNGSYPYLRSHPLNSERISDMQGRFQFKSASTAMPLATDHALVAARARVLARPGVDVLRLWVDAASSGEFARSSPAQQAGTLYAAALAAIELRDARAARAAVERLVAHTAADAQAARLARLLSAEIELAAGAAPRAAALLDPKTKMARCCWPRRPPWRCSRCR